MRKSLNKPARYLRLLSMVAIAVLLSPFTVQAADTIKVGVLHSLSGTMAISETTLKDTVLIMVDDLNKGGLLGKKVEAVVVDPASNWPLFAEKARELLSKNKVDVVFGCWTSVSRKSVLPVFEELNGLLFYRVQYEGEESSRNVFYTGAAPNQQAITAVEYLMSEDGGNVKRWVLAGTDYVYPRTTNKILEAFLKSKGVKSQDILINYTPFGHADWQTIVADIKKFASVASAGKKTAVVSTINGDANVPFYKELANQGIKADDIPVVAFSVGEEELAGIDTSNLVGHLAGMELLPVRGCGRKRVFHQEVARLHQGHQARDQRSHGSHRHRLQHVDPGGETGGHGGGGRGAAGHVRAGGQVPERLRHRHEHQPPPLEAGHDRRDPAGRTVRDRLADRGPHQGRCLEPLHPGERQLGVSLGLRQLREAEVHQLIH